MLPKSEPVAGRLAIASLTFFLHFLQPKRSANSLLGLSALRPVGLPGHYPMKVQLHLAIHNPAHAFHQAVRLVVFLAAPDHFV